MMKLHKKKGFTLAELLVVVAIIAILVAIAIPTFSAATARAELATEVANARTCYAQGMSNQIAGDTTPVSFSADKKTFTFNYTDSSVTVAAAGKDPKQDSYTAADFRTGAGL